MIMIIQLSDHIELSDYTELLTNQILSFQNIFAMLNSFSKKFQHDPFYLVPFDPLFAQKRFPFRSSFKNVGNIVSSEHILL